MITVGIERIELCFPELIQIFPEHWAELAVFKDRMPLAPQFSEYVTRERTGRLFLATVRRDGRIVAYYTAQVAPGFHYGSTLCAHMDMMYIVASERGQGLALPLFRCVEREMRRRGVQIWYSGLKEHNPLGMPALLDRLGFIPVDIYYGKWIG